MGPPDESGGAFVTLVEQPRHCIEQYIPSHGLAQNLSSTVGLQPWHVVARNVEDLQNRSPRACPTCEGDAAQPFGHDRLRAQEIDMLVAVDDAKHAVFISGGVHPIARCT